MPTVSAAETPAALGCGAFVCRIGQNTCLSLMEALNIASGPSMGSPDKYITLAQSGGAPASTAPANNSACPTSGSTTVSCGNAVTSACLSTLPNKSQCVNGAASCSAGSPTCGNAIISACLKAMQNGSQCAAPSADNSTNCNKVQTAKAAANQTKNNTTAVNKAQETPAASTPAAADSTEAQQVIALVNQYRQEAGLSPLTANSALMSAAQTRASELLIQVSHVRPNGEMGWSMVKSAGFSYFGENIAYGQPTPAAVMTSWMNSASHRKNIMGAQYSSIGVACTRGSDGRMYWVQLFGG